jgi:hypothetical protein
MQRRSLTSLSSPARIVSVARKGDTGQSKSHTGCLLNERVDELAELGRQAENPEFALPPKIRFCLVADPTPPERQCSSKPLPRDSAPNRSLLEAVVAFNTLHAIKKRSTMFVTDLLHHKEGPVISRIIRRCRPTEYRVWLKCMTGTYPVQTYLQRIGVAQTPICPHCDESVPESLTHFACLCPKFREARTSAHNQVRNMITSFLTSTLRPEWTLFEETRMAKTGLILRSSSLIADDVDQLGWQQPDWILVSKDAKRIAIIDLCRPSDIHQTQLQAAAIRKQQAYQYLVGGLSYYTEQGWVVHAFLLIVGIRG